MPTPGGALRLRLVLLRGGRQAGTPDAAAAPLFGCFGTEQLSHQQYRSESSIQPELRPDVRELRRKSGLAQQRRKPARRGASWRPERMTPQREMVCAHLDSAVDVRGACELPCPPQDFGPAVMHVVSKSFYREFRKLKGRVARWQEQRNKGMTTLERLGRRLTSGRQRPSRILCRRPATPKPTSSALEWCASSRVDEGQRLEC